MSKPSGGGVSIEIHESISLLSQEVGILIFYLLLFFLKRGSPPFFKGGSDM